MAESGLAALLLDASTYFDNDDLSDVTIVLIEGEAAASTQLVPASSAAQHSAAQDERPAKRQRADNARDNEVAGEASSTQRVLQQQDLAQGSDSVTGQRAQQSTQQQRTHRLPGHKLLLCASSSVFKTQLSNWATDGRNELVLHVPSIEVGELLIKCMYMPAPDFTGSSQQQLLQLVQLADRHDVPKAVFTASRVLSSIPAADLEWETVMAVYNLPPACPDLPAYKPLFAAVAARLQQELGDLELVWGNPDMDARNELQQKLLLLPHLALLTLLSDPATRVLSENTIAYTIHRWHMSHDAAVPPEQLQQLCKEIRMQHCTPLYVGTVMFSFPAIAKSFTQEEQLIATLITSYSYAVQSNAAGANSTTSVARQLAVINASSPVRRRKSWLAAKRPTSALAEYQLQFPVTLQSLQQAVEQALERFRLQVRRVASSRGVYEGPAWQGREFAVCIGAFAERAAASSSAPAAAAAAAAAAPAEGVAVDNGAAAAFGGAAGPIQADMPRAAPAAAAAAGAAAVCKIRLAVQHGSQMPDSAPVTAKYRLMAAAAPANHFHADEPGQEQQQQGIDSGWRSLALSNKFQLVRDFFEIGAVGSWLEAERKLRAKGLVHADNCLHLTLQIKGVVP